MKKLLFLCVVLLAAATTLTAIKTGKSIFYSDSYMLRARGVEASYWNPANLAPGKYIDVWLPFVNSGIQVNNNSLDLDTYNYVVSQEYLTEDDKDMIMRKLSHILHGSVSGNMSVFGFTMSNMAFSSSISYDGELSLSKRYMELLLYGNTDSLYVFDKSTTNAKALSYMDLTFGAGNFTIPFLPYGFPEIRAGFSASLLAGIGSADLREFNGYFSSTFDGLTMHQDAVLRSGIGGAGFKSMIGFASSPIENLEVGLTLDNIFGYINWVGVLENQNLHFAADSLYIINLEDDFYTETHESEDIDSFSTELPPELRLAALWSHKRMNFSADYVQGFKNSAVTDPTGRLALGAEVFPAPFLPVHFGIGFGNSNYPWRVSYGIGLKSKTGEFGISVQSYDSLFPGMKSKGLSLGSFVRLWI
ncbi:MAG: DUF5723 family protein [Candidatus Cloacimonetes bacterium]|nr:DUF5723 family protein [Candidatus Cloacimonadota bacterium]